MKKFIFRPKLILFLLLAVIIWVFFVDSFIEIIYPPGASNPCPGCQNVLISLPDYIRYHGALPPFIYDKRAFYQANLFLLLRPIFLFFMLFYTQILLFFYLIKPFKKLPIVLVVANKILVIGAMMIVGILFLYLSGFIGIA